MIPLIVSTLLVCTPVQPKPVKVIAKPSITATFKQRWLALHFRELVK
jgi:hypothetical protein